MDDKSYTVRVPKRWVRLAMIVGVTTLIVAPLTAVATHSFSDVPESNTFHNDIAWLKDAAVTLGCNPPNNTQFCPDDNVTRGQMAAFMKRLAENQVVDADKVDGKEALVLADVTSAQGYDWNGVGNISLSPSGTTIAETEIDVPADGHIVLIGNASVGNSLTNDSLYTIWIEVDEGGCDMGLLEPANSVPGATTNAVDGTADDYSTSVSGVSAVETGTHTVTLCGANSAGDGDAYYASLIAQYTSEASTSIVTSLSSASGREGADG